MKKNIDMLHGPVLPALTKLALPIMATSLIQMAYNLTDMIWIGRLGSNAVAAVGAAEIPVPPVAVEDFAHSRGSLAHTAASP